MRCHLVILLTVCFGCNLAEVDTTAISNREDIATEGGGPKANAKEVTEIVEGCNRFALDLYQQLRSPDGNLFFSPSSISTALAMTYAGAAGQTQDEHRQTAFSVRQFQNLEVIRIAVAELAIAVHHRDLDRVGPRQVKVLVCRVNFFELLGPNPVEVHSIS